MILPATASMLHPVLFLLQFYILRSKSQFAFRNPTPYKIINSPDGPNVYKDRLNDYPGQVRMNH